MKSFLRDLWITVCTLVSLWALGLFTSGCAPKELVPAGASTPAITGASVVTLVRPTAIWTWGSLANEVTEAGFKVKHVKSCNGFAIDLDGEQALVTAAHCVEGYAIGDEVRYLSPDGVGYGVAELAHVDRARDIAWAHVDGLSVLPVTSPPPEGSPVVSVSSYYEAITYGVMRNRLSSGFYETSQTIIKGWSGSPVLDTHGRVWGLVSQCHMNADSSECAPGGTIVTALGM